MAKVKITVKDFCAFDMDPSPQGTASSTELFP